MIVASSLGLIRREILEQFLDPFRHIMQMFRIDWWGLKAESYSRESGMKGVVYVHTCRV